MNGRRGKGTGGPAAARRIRLALVASAIALAVLTAACAERGSGTSSAPSTTPVATTTPTATPSETPSPHERRKGESPSPSASPTVDPYALADGVYPAYMRGVDVRGRTVTVDVVQTFEGWRAKQAALEDGVAPWKARRYKYYPVYIRNENPLLRTLPVVPNATIVFVGECEETTHGAAGLRELADRALPYSTDWYYTITMRGDVVQRIEQHIAIPAC